MPAPLILAVDVGTSSAKAALFQTQGRRLLSTTARQPYRLRVDRSGAAELSMAEVERAIVRIIREVLTARRKNKDLRGRNIVAVGFSCFWHGLLGVDARTQRTTPIYTWADARCREDAARLRARHDENAYRYRTGCMLRTPFWPSKLRWLRRTGGAKGVTH